jgi:flagellar FliL protein
MSDAKDAKKADAKSEAGHAEKPAASGGGSSKLMPIMMGVNSLLLVGVMAFLFLSMKQTKALVAEVATKSSSASEEKSDGKEEKSEKAEKSEKSEKAEKSEKSEKSEKGEGGEGKEGGSGPVNTMVKLPDFVVHLRNPDADRYARLSFDVEVFGESDRDRLTASLPRVRDAFISYLSDRTLEDLRGSEGLSRTKDSLQTTLRQLVPDARIKALYISDFVVQ